MRTVLGVDAGASKTHALVADEAGHALGFGQGGTANHQVCGLDEAMNQIARAVEAAMAEAGQAPGGLEAGCFCLAGADLPEDYAMLQEAIQARGWARSVILKNDTPAALRAGTSRPWGVVVICGTGFNAAGRARDGREIILPGLGAISGDWGGGHELGMETIRQVMRAWDGREKPTLLTDRVLQTFEAPSVEALLQRLYHGEIDQRQVMDLVPLVFEVAQAGDEVARELIQRMGTEVGVTANALIRRLSLETEEVEVVLGGSVFKGKGPLLIDTVQAMVRGIAPRARIVLPRREPVVGATLMALEAIGVRTDETLEQELEASLPPRLRIAREDQED